MNISICITNIYSGDMSRVFFVKLMGQKEREREREKERVLKSDNIKKIKCVVAYQIS